MNLLIQGVLSKSPYQQFEYSISTQRSYLYLVSHCIGHAGGIGVVSGKLQTFLSTWYGRVGQVMTTALLCLLSKEEDAQWTLWLLAATCLSIAFPLSVTTTEDWWVKCKILIDFCHLLLAIARKTKRTMTDKKYSDRLT